jgi:hypothetical protein
MSEVGGIPLEGRTRPASPQQDVSTHVCLTHRQSHLALHAAQTPNASPDDACVLTS